MRGDECIDDAEQLLLGLGRHALDLLDAAFKARADAGRLAGLPDAQQFVGGDVERLCQRDQQAGRRVFRLAFVVGDLPTACADLVGQLLLRVAGSLAELHEARTEAFGAGVELLGHGGIRGGPLERVYPVFVHDGCPVLEHGLECTIFVHITVTTFRHEKVAAGA